MVEPFGAAEALRRGLTPAALRRQLRHRDLLVMRRGTYIDAATWSAADSLRDRTLIELRAAQQCIDGVVGGFETAAIGHRYSLIGRGPRRLLLIRDAAPGRTPADLPGVRVLPAGLPATHQTRIDHVLVTTGARTVVDMGRRRPFRAAVVVADSALHAGLTEEELQAVLADCAGWPGIRAARHVVGFADGRAESPLESLGRVTMWEQSLPTPELQVRLGDEDANIGRVDFLLREQRTVGEADGRIKYLDPRQQDGRQLLYLEKLREDDIRDLGYEMVRFGWRDATRDGERLAAWFRRAFARAARRRAQLI